MQIALSYGKDGLAIEFPDDLDVQVIRKPAMPVLPRPEEAVREALVSPIKAPPLAELAKGKRSACILICDITRPVPNHFFLRPMIETLIECRYAGLRHYGSGGNRPSPSQRR